MASYGGGLFQMVSQRFELYNKGNLLPFDNVKTLTYINSSEIIISNDKELYTLNYNNSVPFINHKISLTSMMLKLERPIMMIYCICCG